MRFNITKLILCSLILVPLFLTSCGGGGGGETGSAQPVYYDISGTITGLTSSGLVLQNNGGDNLSIPSGSTSFTFPTLIANNAAYSVTVLASPTSPSLICTVNNSSGIVAGGNVTGVRVICSSSAYTIRGTVSGLTGSGLVLRNNSTENLAISGDGSFAFSTQVAVGAQYNVTVKTHPSSPTQVCTVGNSIGIVTAADITSISVVCDQIGRRFAYVTNSSDNTVSIYAVNAATGQLQTYGLEPTGLTPLSVTVTTTDPSAQFAYVANYGDNTISAYLIDTVAGTLTPISGSPYVAGTAPRSVTIDPSGQFAYVANSGSGDVSAYTINTTTGELTAIDADTSTVGIDKFAAGTNPQSVTIDPSGLFAYVANSGSDDVSAYTLDTVSGVLTPIDANTSTVGIIDNIAAGNSPQSVTIDPYGLFAYVANQGSDNVSAYAIDVSGDIGTPGGLIEVAGSPFAVGISPQSVTIDPYGQFVYVANSVSNDITAYAIVPSGSASGNEGALILVGSVAAGTTPQPVTVDPTGQFAYVANAGDGTVSAYTISGATGALTMIDADTGTGGIDNFEAGTTPRSVTIDSAGKFAYVLNSGSVSAYTIDSTTGALVAMTGSPFAAGSTPQSVAIDPTGNFAYVANSASNNVSAYTIDAITRALIAVPGSPFAAGASPQSITIHPSLPFAYVTYSGSGGFVSAYAIDIDGFATGILGALTLVNTVTPGTAPQSVTIDSNGQFAYVAARIGASQNGFVSVYTIDASTGALTQLTGSPYATGGFLPKAVTIDPNGQFAYVVNANNSGSGTVAAYTITSGTGELTRITPNVFAGNNPQNITIDPFGQFAYVANSDDGTVSAYTIDSLTGALTRIDADTSDTAIDNFPAGSAPRSVTIDSTGTYAYVANSGDRTISAYTIEATGELTSIGNFAAGANPQSVTIDITDTFAYVANFGDGTISAYTIELTGYLTPVPGSPFLAGTSPRLSIDPDLVSSKFVYVANSGSSNVSAYTINATTGVLTPVPGSPYPAGNNTSSIAITQ